MRSSHLVARDGKVVPRDRSYGITKIILVRESATFQWHRYAVEDDEGKQARTLDTTAPGPYHFVETRFVDMRFVDHFSWTHVSSTRTFHRHSLRESHAYLARTNANSFVDNASGYKILAFTVLSF